MTILYEDVYGEKFSFWENWKRFLEKLDDQKIDQAKKYLSDFLGWSKSIEWKTVIDFGCGSGLMSLCFVLLGAKKVTSVDIDKNSVECALYLRSKYEISSDVWEIVTGSVLDTKFVNSLGKFDVTYSWGVIHHTGNMWAGLGNVVNLTGPKGLLYVAIYNDSSVLLEGTSRFWAHAKKIYAERRWIRPFVKVAYVGYYFVGLILHWKNPASHIRDYGEKSMRGMDFFRDVEDWLGGYPYEYASVQEITDFYEKFGFVRKNLYAARSIGCNEFLFVKN